MFCFSTPISRLEPNVQGAARIKGLVRVHTFSNYSDSPCTVIKSLLNHKQFNIFDKMKSCILGTCFMQLGMCI